MVKTIIHLDTNFLIRALVNGAPEGAALEHWIASEARIGISSVAWCEFLCGPIDPASTATALLMLGTPVPFMPDDAAVAAAWFNAAGRRRGSLADCMVAAVAFRSGAAVATSNLDDFRRFEQLGLTLATP